MSLVEEFPHCNSTPDIPISYPSQPCLDCAIELDCYSILDPSPLQIVQELVIEKARVPSQENLLYPTRKPFEALFQKSYRPLGSIPIARAEFTPQKVPRFANKAKQGVKALSPWLPGVIAHFGSLLLPIHRFYMRVQIKCQPGVLLEIIPHFT
ncbi:MAG: hypothetical protein DDT27_01237 [Dehalococcoidia bacterium]|nr:hypothetical protein [Chloroflexota bacterium]